MIGPIFACGWSSPGQAWDILVNLLYFFVPWSCPPCRDAGMAFMRTRLYLYFTKPIFGVQAFRMRPSVLGLLWHLVQVTSKCGLPVLLMTDFVRRRNVCEPLFCKVSGWFELGCLPSFGWELIKADVTTFTIYLYQGLSGWEVHLSISEWIGRLVCCYIYFMQEWVSLAVHFPGQQINTS